jgi:hypothetical protein
MKNPISTSFSADITTIRGRKPMAQEHVKHRSETEAILDVVCGEYSIAESNGLIRKRQGEGYECEGFQVIHRNGLDCIYLLFRKKTPAIYNMNVSNYGPIHNEALATAIENNTHNGNY